MAYSTDEDLYDRLSEQRVQQLTDDESTGSVDTGLVQDLREKVARKIDMRLRRRYDLPIEDAEAEKVLADIEVDILAHRLYARRPNAEIPESVVERKDAAIEDLKEVARHGGLGIDQDEDGEDDGGSTVRVRRTTDKETLKDKMEGRY